MRLSLSAKGTVRKGLSHRQLDGYQAQHIRRSVNGPAVSHYGQLIDANDLWIAATALAFEMPVVTRNEKHFARVPRLDMVGYACPLYPSSTTRNARSVASRRVARSVSLCAVDTNPASKGEGAR